MIRAVLFDLDGVLVESIEVWHRLMNAAAADFGSPGIPRSALEPLFGQGIEADAELFYRGRTPEEVKAYYDAHFPDHARHLHVDPQARAVLQGLRERGIRTAVVTNTPTAIAREVLRAAGLEPDVLVGAGAPLREKPAPDMVLRACELLGVGPEEAFFVGDSRFDREAAEAAGARFAGLRIPGERTLERIEEVLSWVF
jgi:phosphoglycolate phosphatase/AHBA synthesis associated protein